MRGKKNEVKSEESHTVSDEFGDNSVVFASAGIGTVFSEIVHFAFNSDVGSA